MKKSLILLGSSACVLLAFSSCQSSKTADGGYETATMASDVIADGEIPPWLLEDDSDVQVDAGARTPSRNSFAIPEPSATVADTGSGTGSSRQNQPELAQNDVSIETPTSDIPAIAPPATAPAAASSVPSQPAAGSQTKPKKPQAKIAKNNQSRGKSAKNRGKGRRYEQPTMLTYTVRKGDNLSDIAKRSRTTVAQIKRDSGLKGNTIYPGQTIKVKYIPKNYKPGKKATQGRAAAGSSAKSRNHIIAKGETISGIAKKYGVPYGQILKANNLTAADAVKLRPGKRIAIPAKASSSKPSAKKRTAKKRR